MSSMRIPSLGSATVQRTKVQWKFSRLAALLCCEPKFNGNSLFWQRYCAANQVQGRAYPARQGAVEEGDTAREDGGGGGGTVHQEPLRVVHFISKNPF